MITDDCGILVEPMDEHQIADAIVQLLEDEDMRARMGENARMRVFERFTSQKVVERYRVFIK